MASVVGTYARAFADVVMTAKNQLDPARALVELHSIEALLTENAPCWTPLPGVWARPGRCGILWLY